jgi:hypothetical protein
MCSTSQADWIYVQPTGQIFFMCQSYCADLREACATELTVGGLSVEYLYPTSNAFCNALFFNLTGGSYHMELFLNAHNTDCWANEPGNEKTQFSFQGLEQ